MSWQTIPKTFGFSEIFYYPRDYEIKENSLVICPFLSCSTLFLTLPLRFSNLDVSIEAARLRTDLPGFASGFSIHQDDLPVPSFCTLINRLCSDKLCLIEFWKRKEKGTLIIQNLLRSSLQYNKKNLAFKSKLNQMSANKKCHNNDTIKSYEWKIIWQLVILCNTNFLHFLSSYISSSTR